MMVSLALKDSGLVKAEPVIGVSSTLVPVSLVLFAANLFRNGGVNRSPDDPNVHLRTQAAGKL